MRPTFIQGTTLIRGHCEFTWVQPDHRFDPAARTYEILPDHCQECIKELRWGWPEAQFITAPKGLAVGSNPPRATPAAVGPSVLVVQDDPAAREATAAVLEGAGHLVFRATDGRHALELLRQGVSVGAVIVDLSMSSVSGEELLGHLRAEVRFVTLPVVIITADREPAPLGAGQRALGKPVDPQRLLDAVQGLLRHD